jgi:hypothetical protein
MPELTGFDSLSGSHMDRHEQRLIQLVKESGTLADSLKDEFNTMRDIEV